MSANVERYVKRMENIKKRFRSIETVLNDVHSTGSWHTNFEFVALQLRKVFETIVLSTVDSNEGALAAINSAALSEWNIGNIIKEVRKVNPAFYPVPFQQKTVSELESFDGEYLTLERLKEFHGRCGDWMHARALDFEQVDFKSWHRKFDEWLHLTISLLGNHAVQLAESDLMLWVSMNEKETGKVVAIKVERVREQGAAS